MSDVTDKTISNVKDVEEVKEKGQSAELVEILLHLVRPKEVRELMKRVMTMYIRREWMNEQKSC